MNTLRESVEVVRSELAEQELEQELADLLFEMDELLAEAGFEVEDDGTLTVEEYISTLEESFDSGELSEFIGAVATGASLARKGMKMVFGKLRKVGAAAKKLAKRGVQAVKREYHSTQATRYKRKAAKAAATAAKYARAAKAASPSKPVQARPGRPRKKKSPLKRRKKA
jgi:hypothetical protein